jgi:hypothetical protein
MVSAPSATWKEEMKMENPNLKKALAVLSALLAKQEAQVRAMKANDEAIEKAKAAVSQLVVGKA